jgi:hypothetical protein
MFISLNDWDDHHGCDGRHNGQLSALSTVISSCLVSFHTQCVERSRFEPNDIRGQMQSNYYTIRFSGQLTLSPFTCSLALSLSQLLMIDPISCRESSWCNCWFLDQQQSQLGLGIDFQRSSSLEWLDSIASRLSFPSEVTFLTLPCPVLPRPAMP